MSFFIFHRSYWGKKFVNFSSEWSSSRELSGEPSIELVKLLILENCEFEKQDLLMLKVFFAFSAFLDSDAKTKNDDFCFEKSC